jgi:hypothetical protein
LRREHSRTCPRCRLFTRVTPVPTGLAVAAVDAQVLA